MSGRLFRRGAAAAPLLSPLSLLALASPAGAVILATGDGTGNTEAPDDDFGFANVGTTGETGVYLGNGWVLTANHVGAREIRFGDTAYRVVPRSKRRLHNDEPGVSPDVALFRLREPLPPLPALRIRETPPARGDVVYMAGNGPNRGAATTFEDHRGWRWGDGRRLRWGTNHVEATELWVQATPGDRTRAFATRFSIGAPTLHESTVGVGDSGGGAFIHDGERWELAGILFAAGGFDGQPPRTAFFGNLSYVADLSHYRDQVLAVAGMPACRDGLDDDGDGRVDFPADTGCTHPDDRQETAVCETGRTPGDANRDGRADGRDYAVWTEHEGSETTDGEDAGDFDCDGRVDAIDFEVWRRQREADARPAAP